MGSSGGGSRTTQQTTIPEEFKPYFTRLFESAEQASKQVPSTPFPGPFVAPVNPLQQQAVGMTGQLGQQLSGIGQGTLNLGQQTLAGDFLRPESNPYLTPYITSALRPAMEGAQQTLSNVRAQASGQGAFENVRRNLLEAQIAGQTQKNLLDIASQIGMANYGQERQYQQAAPGLLQAGIGLQEVAPRMLAQAGDAARQLAGIPIQEALLQYQAAQEAPFAPLIPYASIIQGTPVGSTTRIQGTPQAGGIGGGIAGGLGGAASGAALGSLAMPGLGTILGALLGGGLGGYAGAQ